MEFNRTTLTTQQAVLDTLVIDRRNGVPQYRQLHEQLRALLLRRALRPGMRLPSTRALSADLGMARNTVVAVYEQLATEGFIETGHGARARITALPCVDPGPTTKVPTPLSESFSRRGRALAHQEHSWAHSHEMLLQPGMPEVREFPFGAWRRLLLARMRPSSTDLFGYHSFGGHQPLRAAIASHLEASRGVRCAPDQVLITSGAQGALSFLAALFLDPGDDVLLEDPGYTAAQGAFLAAGASLVPLPVDEKGWGLEELERARPKLIYLTPSCQFPIGITMRMEQRLKMLELARSTGAWIIEDDFDSEYRFSTKRIPAMQGVDDTGRTIYVGTFAKTLFPSLRIGFLVMPSPFDEEMTKALFLLGQTAPLFLQATLADFINEGHFARHLRRMRRLYARRRTLFGELVQRYAGEWLEPVKGESGLQTVWKLKGGLEDTAVARAAAEVSVSTTPLSIHYRHRTPEQGLILGFASADEQRMHLGLTRLRSTLERVASDGRAPVGSRPPAARARRPRAGAPTRTRSRDRKGAARRGRPPAGRR